MPWSPNLSNPPRHHNFYFYHCGRLVILWSSGHLVQIWPFLCYCFSSFCSSNPVDWGLSWGVTLDLWEVPILGVKMASVYGLRAAHEATRHKKGAGWGVFEHWLQKSWKTCKDKAQAWILGYTRITNPKIASCHPPLKALTLALNTTLALYPG